MSFAQEVKTDICKNELKPCCQKAQLSALIQICSSLNISNQQLTLDIKTQNPTIAKRILFLIKQLYVTDTQLSMFKQLKFKKKHSYEIKVLSNVKEILEDLTLMSDEGLAHHPKAGLVRKDCCGRAYLAGAFLAVGSINSPLSSNYHCEIAVSEKRLADFIVKLMSRYEIVPKIIMRRNRHVIYIKQSEKIGDFLRLSGAYESLMKFEDSRIQRDYINNLSRLDNCDIANEIKVQQSAGRQYEDILLIQERIGLDRLDKRLEEVALLRLEHQDVSLLELSHLYGKKYQQTISKSGIRHRINKLHEIADRLKK